MSSKRSNLVSLFEEEENNPKVEDSTFLNSSTVPTYEEFTKKTTKNLLFNRYLNSTQGLSRLSIVTDDESDEENKVQSKSLSKKQINGSIKSESLKTPSKLVRLDSLSDSGKLNTPKATLLGTPTLINSPWRTPKMSSKTQSNESDDEYGFYENKLVQTSFDSIVELDSQSDQDLIIEESIIELPNHNEKNPELSSFRENSNIKEFNLRLSSSSGTTNSEPHSKKNSLSPTPSSQILSIVEANVTQRKKQAKRASIKLSKKRVSICGQAFDDNVFNIDDTIVDQFDNENDHQKGLIYSIVELNGENSNAEMVQTSSLFSSTKLNINQKNLPDFQVKDSFRNKEQLSSSEDEMSNKFFKKENRKDPSSSDNDDAFEKFLRQHRPKEETDKEIKDNDLKDFIVDDSVDEDSGEENDQDDIIKKKTSRKLIHSRIKNIKEFKSSSDSSNKSDSDDFDEQYEHDLQLFYIRTTNSINKNNEKKNEKKLECSLSDSSQSDSETSIIKNSSSDSENDDSFSRIFKNKTNIRREADNTCFKTPKKNPDRLENDLRLVKTAFIPRQKEPLKKLSFIESLSKNIENENLRDPSVEHYVKKFHLKSVRQELLNECYRLFNKYAFDNKLPMDMKLVWSDKITSTAGYCKYSSKELSCEIHISTKVCTDPERLRDTLAHEMCHAAAFLVSRCNDNHGPIWKSWTRKVNFAFRHIPKITVTHSYSITKKFIFRCTRCHLEIHRFSKSINVEKEVCGICHGRFEVIKNSVKNANLVNNYKKQQMENRFDEIKSELYGTPMTPKQNQAENKLLTPRQPNKFALFVKENYGSVKKEKNLSTHKDVMQELSKNFKLLSTK